MSKLPPKGEWARWSDADFDRWHEDDKLLRAALRTVTDRARRLALNTRAPCSDVGHAFYRLVVDQGIDPDTLLVVEGAAVEREADNMKQNPRDHLRELVAHMRHIIEHAAGDHPGWVDVGLLSSGTVKEAVDAMLGTGGG